MIRINKYLADSGVCSRRNADKLVEEGRVKINNVTVTELGKTVNENNDTVTVDGIAVKPVKNYMYVLFYKPKGCITTASDEKGRKTIFDYIDLKERLFPIGRLDYDSEGLLILTNDGALSQKIAHPSNEIPKTYIVKVEGDMPEHKLAQLRKGVLVDGEKTKRSKVKLLEYSEDTKISRLEVTITEGRNRQVRKMFEAVERNVIFLKRVAVGELRLGGLKRGGYRLLKDYEIEYLKKM